MDWSQGNGIDEQVAQSVIAEVGVDLNALPTEKHFANRLGLCPTNETSGGRVLKRRTPKVVNRAKVAFRQAASSLIRSRSYLARNTAGCVRDWAPRKLLPRWPASYRQATCSLIMNRPM